MPQPEVSKTPEAISRLRTVEFRQTLRGYHIDDVDEYLERVAIEVAALKDQIHRKIAHPRIHPIPMAETDQLSVSHPSMRPQAGWAIVTCMDTRVDVGEIFGLHPGEAHVIRNAGGVVTDDTIRSLAISQRLGGTDSILLVHHTDCALSTISEERFTRQVAMEAGVNPPWAAGAIGDLEKDLRRCIARLQASPFLAHKDAIRGFIYDVESRELAEIDSSAEGTSSSELATATPMWSNWW